MSEVQLYAPDYLRAQKDPQLHRIAEMIERQVETMNYMSKKLDDRDRKEELTTLIKGHMEAMRPLLDEWSKLNAGPEPVVKGDK